MTLTRNHDGLSVSSKTILQQPGEDRVAVRDEQRLAVGSQ